MQLDRALVHLEAEEGPNWKLATCFRMETFLRTWDGAKALVLSRTLKPPFGPDEVK
jgi:hypothetical protein